MSSEQLATAVCDGVDADDASMSFAPRHVQQAADACAEAPDGDLIAGWDDREPAAEVLEAAPSARPNRRLGDRISIGRLVIPTVLLGWLGSVAVHAAVIAIGICVARRAVIDVPGLSFVQGDGASETGIENLGTGVAPNRLDPADLQAEDPPSVAAQPSSTLRVWEDSASLSDAEADPVLPESLTSAQSSVPPLDHRDTDAMPWIGPPPADHSPQPRARPQPSGGAATALASSVSKGAPAPNSSDSPERGPIGTGGAPSDGGTPGVADGDLLSALAAPIYPLESRRRREQGEVILELDLMPDGSVAAVTVIRDGGGHPLLVQAAINAVHKSHLPPLRQDGIPIRASIKVPFRFFLRS